MHDINYGKTIDGLEAALLGDMAYVAMPLRAGGYRVAEKWRPAKPLAEMHSDEFYSYHRVPDIEGFRARMETLATHKRQLAALGRVEVSSSTTTPWGRSQGMLVFAEGGIYSHSTAGHGGFKVYKKFNDMMPEPYRNKGGWYEEDCEWAKVALSFPQLFTDMEVAAARETVRNWYPDEYEAVTGEVIPVEESRTKAQRAFDEAHKDDWVVIAASSFEDDEGRKMVGCMASKGGKRSGYFNGVEVQVETENFVVPAGEYDMGQFGFVIDETRHPRFEEASPASPSM